MRAVKLPGLALCLAAAGGALLAAPNPGSEEQRAAGKALYEQYCIQCHGENGDGQGDATSRVKPQPRDFTSGKYKFRVTPSGMLPTDADIKRSIKLGLPYSSMPAFPNLNETKIQNLVYYIKAFSEDFENPEKFGDPIEIPEPPPVTDESIERGKLVYADQGCAACHGELGRGDGLSAPTMTDDWGQHIRPADMSQRWTFRGGPTRKDMFRTFSTGLNGTPMPSYFDSVEVSDRWDLVNYMVSLGDGDDPQYSNLLRVAYLEDEIDVNAGPELFQSAPKARFPLVGQIIEPGRDFYPSTTSVEVQAVYNRREIAFLVRWHDMRAETDGTNAPDLELPPWDEDQPGSAAAGDGGDEDDFWGGEAAEAEEGDFWGDEAQAGDEEDGDDFWGEEEGGGAPATGSEFSDAVALQFPSSLPSGIRKPYFLFGDAGNSVDLWFVDLARPIVQQFVGRGSDSLELSENDEIEIHTGYDRGEWFAIFKRSMSSTSTVAFQSDQYVPIAFSVWDGFNRERGNKRALSSWVYLYVEPTEQVSPVGPMARAAVGALVIELLLVFWIRRRYGSGSGQGSRSAAGAIPQGGMAGPHK